jgi:hypothetical protein
MLQYFLTRSQMEKACRTGQKDNKRGQKDNKKLRGAENVSTPRRKTTRTCTSILCIYIISPICILYLIKKILLSYLSQYICIQ